MLFKATLKRNIPEHLLATLILCDHQYGFSSNFSCDHYSPLTDFWPYSLSHLDETCWKLLRVLGTNYCSKCSSYRFYSSLVFATPFSPVSFCYNRLTILLLNLQTVMFHRVMYYHPPLHCSLIFHNQLSFILWWWLHSSLLYTLQ